MILLLGNTAVLQYPILHTVNYFIFLSVIHIFVDFPYMSFCVSIIENTTDMHEHKVSCLPIRETNNRLHSIFTVEEKI